MFVDPEVTLQIHWKADDWGNCQTKAWDTHYDERWDGYTGRSTDFEDVLQGG